MYLLTYLLTYCGVLVRAKYQLDRYYYSAPDNGARSIVMSVSVCVRVCLSVRDHISGTTCPIFTNFLRMLPMAVARSSSDA